MKEMMAQCYGADGQPDPEKMKQFFGDIRQFMERCAKADHTEDDFAQMQDFATA